MSFITAAIDRCVKSRRASAIARASRAVVEPLEMRAMLNGVVMLPGGLPSYWSMMGSRLQDVSHGHHHHKTNPAANMRAYPMSEALGGVSGPGATPSDVSNPSPITGALVPSQMLGAYGFSNVLLPNGGPATGAGETIGIVDAYHDANIASDLHTFDVQYLGGVDPNFTQVNLGNSTGGWEFEESLDVEWAHAIAPQANIVLVEAATNSYVNLIAAVDKAVALGANAVSMSWGGGEAPTYDSHFAVPNVAFVAASGDNGAPGQWPAASSNVLGVGGTSLWLNANNSWAGEAGWSDSGGSISINETRPTFQPTTYNNGTTTGIPLTNRGIPDVSYSAATTSAVSVYDSVPYSNPNGFSGSISGWLRATGTSCGAPQWAALIALADQGRAQLGLSQLGASSILPTLYANPRDFHDVLTGTSLGTTRFTAAPGYDLVTGLGTPQAPLVVSSLIGATPAAAPAAPNGLVAVPGDGNIALQWNATTGASSWNVYRSTDGATYTPYVSVSQTGFADTGLSDGTSYYYEVTAANSIGESAPSTVVSAIPQVPPAAPTLLSAAATYANYGTNATHFGISLQWTTSSGATTYNVLRSSTSGSGYAMIASGLSGTGYVDSAVTSGTAYYYVIEAVNAAGAQSSFSGQFTGTAFPSAPTNLTATSGNSQIALAWISSTGATSYKVFRSTTNGSSYSLLASGITSASFTDKSLTIGVTYYYIVQAIDAGGASANSNQASATAKHGK
jgi:subtilase family serine protease